MAIKLHVLDCTHQIVCLVVPGREESLGSDALLPCGVSPPIFASSRSYLCSSAVLLLLQQQTLVDGWTSFCFLPSPTSPPPKGPLISGCFASAPPPSPPPLQFIPPL